MLRASISLCTCLSSSRFRVGIRKAVLLSVYEASDPVFVTVVVHFQVVGHLLAALAITQHSRV